MRHHHRTMTTELAVIRQAARRRDTGQAPRGAILVLIAVMLPVLVMFAAFGVNVAYMELSRTELQISTDAAVRAGGRTYAQTGDMAQARMAARDAAARNHVAGLPLSLGDSDFHFGLATRAATASRYTFTPEASPFNALQVEGRRTTGSQDGPIRLLLPNVFGTNRFEPTQIAMSTQVELDIAVVLDRSGSMAYADSENSNTYDPPAAAPPAWQFGDPAPTPSRWRDAVAAVDAFLMILQQTPLQEQVSLATYADNGIVDTWLSTNYDNIRNGMDVYTNNYREGMTAIGTGIERGIDTLCFDSAARPWAAKVIVLLTDGIHNAGTSPTTAANLARSRGVTIFAVTFSAEANQQRMRRVAQITNGKHYHAQFGSELTTAFEDIAHSLPTLIAK